MSTYQERQREANKRWRTKNAEFLKEYHRKRYIAKREQILANYHENYSKKPKKERKIKPLKPTKTEGKVVVQKHMKLSEIIEVLRKDLRHRLWGLCVRDWKESDWEQFQNLKNSA
jgi:hypothetical protein